MDHSRLKSLLIRVQTKLIELEYERDDLSLIICDDFIPDLSEEIFSSSFKESYVENISRFTAVDALHFDQISMVMTCDYLHSVEDQVFMKSRFENFYYDMAYFKKRMDDVLLLRERLKGDMKSYSVMPELCKCVSDALKDMRGRVLGIEHRMRGLKRGYDVQGGGDDQRKIRVISKSVREKVKGKLVNQTKIKREISSVCEDEDIDIELYTQKIEEKLSSISDIDKKMAMLFRDEQSEKVEKPVPFEKTSKKPSKQVETKPETIRKILEVINTHPKSTPPESPSTPSPTAQFTLQKSVHILSKPFTETISIK